MEGNVHPVHPVHPFSLQSPSCKNEWDSGGHPGHPGHPPRKGGKMTKNQAKMGKSMKQSNKRATSPKKPITGYCRSKCPYYQTRYCVNSLNCEKYMRDSYRPSNRHQLNLSLCKEEFCPFKVTTTKRKV